MKFYTHTDIKARKLDAAIAEALGWENIKIKERPFDVLAFGEPPKPKEEKFGDIRDVENIPLYSTDGNAMLELISDMWEKGYDIAIETTDEKEYFAAFWSCEIEVWLGATYADTLPKAVALAAYKALTGKEWRE